MNESAREYDNRPLAYRVGVLKDDGTESSIPTIRRAFQYLNSELGEWKATPEWQSALDMLAAAHSEYTPVNIKKARPSFALTSLAVTPGSAPRSDAGLVV